jgi:hypothetical protein
MTNKKPRITCRWLERKKILVNPDGQVLPCCYLANTLYLNLSNPKLAPEWDNTEILKKYKEKLSDYNLNNKNIEDILSSDWFNIDLPESWESYDTLAHPCKTFCDE